MADTTTTTYSLVKPEVGASEDTWGAKINTTLDTLDDLLDGTTAIAPNLSVLKVAGVAVTSTAAELNILDGVTSTAVELNLLDGVTATTGELNKLDGLTATTGELNKLDGILSSVTELNYTNGVTSAIQTQLNAKAALASPPFTGVPTAPTATAGTDTTQLATTAFVNAEIAADVPTVTAALSVGSVGTYAFLRQTTTNTPRSPGATLSGSSLRYSSSNDDGSPPSATPSGTWRLMGSIGTGSAGPTNTSLWLRVS